MEELGSGVRWAAAERVQFIPYGEVVAEAKVSDFDVHVSVKQKVLGLEIAVDYVLLVAILHRRDNLQEEKEMVQSGWVRHESDIKPTK